MINIIKMDIDLVNLMNVDINRLQYLSDEYKRIVLDSLDLLDPIEDIKIRDRDLALFAVEYDGMNLAIINHEYLLDTEIVNIALKNDVRSCQFISPLMIDTYKAREIVSNDAMCLQHLVSYSDDYHIVSIAVCKSGESLKYASERLKADKKICLMAIRSWPYAIKYVSDQMKDNEEVCLAAVSGNGCCIRYLSDRMKSNNVVRDYASLSMMDVHVDDRHRFMMLLIGEK